MKNYIPGIDDCDYLYSLSSRNGGDSVYIRVQETQPGVYCAAVTVDSESGHFVDDLPADGGKHGSPSAAFLANVQTARDWFHNNGLRYTYCNESRATVKRRR